MQSNFTKKKSKRKSKKVTKDLWEPFTTEIKEDSKKLQLENFLSEEIDINNCYLEIHNEDGEE